MLSLSTWQGNDPNVMASLYRLRFKQDALVLLGMLRFEQDALVLLGLLRFDPGALVESLVTLLWGGNVLRLQDGLLLGTYCCLVLPSS